MGKADAVIDEQLKKLRSGFGKQVKSDNNTQPAYGFGTGIRENAEKQYLSAEHAKVSNGNNSQGPVYKTYSGIGSQVDSRLQSSSNFTFGSSQRLAKSGRSWVPGPGSYRLPSAVGEQKDSRKNTSPKPVFGSSTRDSQEKVFLDDELMKAYYGKESPGPNTYQVPPAVGKQMDSRKESSPAWKQGSGPRFKYDYIERSKDLPGAGQYGYQASVGRQNLSPKKTLPIFSFGTSTREASKKTFISKEHEKAAFGDQSPGPMTAGATSAMGKQNLSQRNSSPGWGFGTAQRIKDYGTENPGPGTYYA